MSDQSPESQPQPEPVGVTVPWWRRRPERPVDAVPITLRIAAEWSWRLVVIGLAVAVTIWLIAQVSLIFVSLFVALLLTALLQPAMSWQLRVRVPRGIALFATMLAFLALLAGFLLFLTNTLVGGYDEMAGEATQGISNFKDWLVNGPLGLDQADIDGYANELIGVVEANRQAVVSGAFTTAATALRIATGVVLVLFATLFFLYDGDRIWRWTVHLFPPKHHNSVDNAGRAAWLTLAGYIRGTTVVAFVDGFLIGLALVLLGIPYAIPLGILVLLGGFVPIVGATVSGAVAVLVALATDSFLMALIVLAVVIGVQQLEGQVLQPFLLGHMVRLYPLVIAVAVLAGGLVAGVVGAVVAVPLVAAGNAIVVSLRDGEPVGQEDEPAQPPT